MEKVVIKRALATEGVPALIEDPRVALEVFEEILRRGRLFYADDEASEGYPRICRVIDLQGS